MCPKNFELCRDRISKFQGQLCFIPSGVPSGKYFLSALLINLSNVDFKLCLSQKDGQRLRRKVESASSEAKIVRIGRERRKVFPSRKEKRTNGLFFFALEGKVEQRIRISARKRLRDTRRDLVALLLLDKDKELLSYNKRATISRHNYSRWRRPGNLKTKIRDSEIRFSPL